AVVQIRSPAVPRGSGKNPAGRLPASVTACRGETSEPLSGDELSNHFALLFAEFRALLTHGAGGQGSYHVFRSQVLERLAAQEWRNIQVVAHGTVCGVETGAVRRSSLSHYNHRQQQDNQQN